MADQLHNMPKELAVRSAESSEDIDTSRPGQIAAGLSSTAASGSLAYFIGVYPLQTLASP